MNQPRTRVKICGITRLEDALVADELGVDALGFVFVPASSRYVTPEHAARLVRRLTPFVSVVGLFLNPQASDVENAMQQIPSMVPQFHGQESGEFCDSFNRPYIKAIGVGNSMPTATELAQFNLACGFLLDSNEPGALGGTGHVFDWTRLEDKLEKPLVLAGGLNVQNIADAIEQVAPHAVDVSSGVESAKGIKDPLVMQKFMRAVAKADALKSQRDN